MRASQLVFQSRVSTPKPATQPSCQPISMSVFALEVPTLVLDSEVAVFARQLISRFE